MRRLLLSLGLALLVGGTVVGAAATLPIDPTTLSAGSAVVSSCDSDGSTVSWTTEWAPGPPGYFRVSEMRLSNLDPACAPLYAWAVLRDGTGALLGNSTGAWDTTANNAFVFTFGSAIPASSVMRLDVAIS